VIVFPMGVWVASEKARTLRDLIEQTRTRMALNRQEFADLAGLTEKQLSDQLTLKAPLNIYRLADVSKFFYTLLFVLAEHYDCVVYPKHMVKLIVRVESQPRPMLKAELPYAKEEKAS
jgi:hypothetical protein